MPYNSETETFYQAPATVVDSTPDGDTVQEGFDDRLTPALTALYDDLNLLKADGMISVGIPATTTARGIGRVATSADLVDGATITNGPAFLAAGVHTSVAAAAGKIPVADAGGSLNNWIGTRYASCATDAATATKEATLDNFILVKGARIFVIFYNKNSSLGAITLNVNSTGAVAVRNEDGPTSASNPAYFPAGRAIEFVYDGSNWVYQAAKIASLGTRSTVGTWTLTGCAVGKPIYITFDTAAWNSESYAALSIISGAAGGNWGATPNATITMGRWNDDWRSTSSIVIVPTSPTVVINVQGIGGTTPILTAWQ